MTVVVLALTARFTAVVMVVMAVEVTVTVVLTFDCGKYWLQ